MSDIVIRRRQTDGPRTVSEIVVPVTDKTRTGRSLTEFLYGVQRERGRGLWSDADPEVLVNGSAVGRLRKHEAIEELVEHILECVRWGG
jgi:hypothetical protein